MANDLRKLQALVDAGAVELAPPAEVRPDWPAVWTVAEPDDGCGDCRLDHDGLMSCTEAREVSALVDEAGW